MISDLSGKLSEIVRMFPNPVKKSHKIVKQWCPGCRRPIYRGGVPSTLGTDWRWHKTCLKSLQSLTRRKNPKSLYEQFHGVAPSKVTPVYFEPPPKELISIGELSQLNYRPMRGQHKNVEFYHKSGDTGSVTLRTNLVLATDKKGKNLYLVKRSKSSKFPIFTEKGIIG